MTAEVVVLNKQCVALAADSAITTGDRKIFNTVNKVFALSKSQPVGIMVYGAAEVMGVPVESVVKEFRRVQGTREYPHLEDYAAAFEDFLRTDKSLFNDSARLHSLGDLAVSCIVSIQNKAERKLGQRSGWGSPPREKARKALLDTLAEGEAEVANAGPLQIADLQTTRRRIEKQVASALGDAISWLREYFVVNAETARRLRTLVMCHFECDVDSGCETGFVITGFGGQEVFPRLRAFELCCSAAGVHKTRRRQEVDISDTLRAQIAPFSQIDVMATFVEGVSPSYKLAILSFLDVFLREKATQLRDADPPRAQEAQAVDTIAVELRQQVSGLLTRIAQRGFVAPLMHVVSSMPKEECALLAEALVNLTALKRRASEEAETVGGPTDVAVISKGDGFVWIKRKQYFEAALNPMFTARYTEARQ